jgi:hypothetical protein
MRRGAWLDQDGTDKLREAVPGPVQAAFDRAQVATGDLRNLLVALPLELPQDEDLPMVLGQPLGPIYGVLLGSAAIQVVRGAIVSSNCNGRWSASSSS